MLLPSLGISIANVGLSELARAFNASFQTVQWVVLAYLLAVTTLIVSAGRLGDITGRKHMLLAGIALFTMASLLCGAAPTLWLLVVARAAQGLGAAVMMALAMALVGETVPKARIGSAMGLVGTMSAIGTALGPSLGGLLIATSGWQAIFLVSVPFGIATFMLVFRHLPADRVSRTSRPSFDRLGTLLLGVTLGAYALAMTIGHGQFGLLNAGLLLAAAAGAGLFALVETKVVSPLFRPAMLRDRKLSTGLAVNGLVATVMMATLVVGPFYLMHGLGLDTASTGLVLSVGPIMSALAGLPSGRLVDRFGASRTAIIGLAAVAAGAGALSLVPVTFGVVGYVLPILLATAGYALFQAANNTAAMANVGPDRRGLVSGVLQLSRYLGLITGASAMGAVFAFAVGSEIVAADPAAVAAGMRFTFAVAAGLIVLALGITLPSSCARSDAN